MNMYVPNNEFWAENPERQIVAGSHKPVYCFVPGSLPHYNIQYGWSAKCSCDDVQYLFSPGSFIKFDK